MRTCYSGRVQLEDDSLARLGCSQRPNFAESSLERGYRVGSLSSPPPLGPLDDTLNTQKRVTMKFFWAVCALLLSCWRVNASTGKNFASAILVEAVRLDFALLTGSKRFHSWSCAWNATVVSINVFVTEITPPFRLDMMNLSGVGRLHTANASRDIARETFG